MTDNASSILPVVLSGGSGTRLWPASRESQPKQLLPLTGDVSMMRATVDRVAAIGTEAQPLIVANAQHADAIDRELTAAGYHDATLILEPFGRNTAPAVAIAAHEASRNGDPLILVLPADHTIDDEREFARAVAAACEAAEVGYLVTFGIEPSRPETGYGYVKIGSPITERAHRVDAFKEKPDAPTAAEYVDSGQFLWNSGMFLFRASRYLEELKQHAPDIAAASATAYATLERRGGRLLLDDDTFGAIRSESIDYAVMERTDKAAVVPTDPEWSDVGSWESLWDIADSDDSGNALSGDVIALGTSGSYIRGDDRLIAAIDLSDVVIVDTPDALLVTKRQSAQRVKEIVDELKLQKRAEVQHGSKILRSWGRYTVLESGPSHRLLRLSLDPLATTPPMSHQHRGEHWFVVSGGARAAIGGTHKLVPAGESVYIPPGEMHSLENTGDSILEVVVLEIGASSGEGDIT